MLSAERGDSLVELLTVMEILGVVMTGVTALLVEGSNAEVDMNARFQAQQTARVAFDKIRREGHCASLATLTGQTKATLTVDAACGSQVSWCTVAVSGTTRYALYRQSGATCGSSGVKWADYLTSGNVFTYTAQSSQSLAKLSVDLPVNVRPTRTYETYDLKGDIALRNSTRT
jgi:type II secretory pathway pseudopilin PulG